DRKMIVPFQKVMVNGHISYFILIIVTYVITLFFWPTPAVPLIGAILIPAAIRAGLPPLRAGIAVALAGQGVALSSDYVIHIAAPLSASPSDLGVSTAADKGLVLSLVTGIVAIVLAYFFIRRQILHPDGRHLEAWEKEGADKENVENAQ